MTPERWLRVKDIYHAVSECLPAAREELLADSCGADADLRREVESLLAEDGSRAGVLDVPAVAQTSVGTQIGPYRITSSIGKGGMGEVWKARDSRLNRDVAIKFSAQQFTDRFEREAHAIAALNHANVCTLHDIGPNYLVMELVEGPTLAERIKRGPIPLEEALGIASQIADALEAAHEKGIVHRDLKPANIKIRPDGSVKVLDFGIARAGDEVQTMTAPGMAIGTPGYMPPEQVRGEKVDKRADIWAFGVVLFEMVSGRRPVDGDSDLSLAPLRLRRLLRRCLEKNARLRLRDIGDAMALVDEGLSTAPSQSRLGMRVGWIAAGVMALVAGAFAIVHFRESMTNTDPASRFSIDIAPAEKLGFPDRVAVRPSRTAIAISPDGRTVVFNAAHGATYQLYKRGLNSFEAVAMPGTDDAYVPFFSPDGEWVGFQAGQQLKKIHVNGGPAVTICDVPDRVWGGMWGASWGTDNTIVFAMKWGLMRVPAAGGESKLILATDQSKGEIFSSPQWLPDGKTILLTVQNSPDWDKARIVAKRLDTGQQRDLLTGGADARYVPTGHLLYVHFGTLMAVAFDDRRLELGGEPVALLEGLMQSVDMPSGPAETGMGQFAISATGNLIYAMGGINPPILKTLVRVDRKGVVKELGVPKAPYYFLRVSPDGQNLAFEKQSGNIRISDIWVFDILRGTSARLTTEGANGSPEWSPDGKQLVYPNVGARQIMSVKADGSGGAELALPGEPLPGSPASISSDGKLLAYLISPNSGNWQIWTRAMSGGEKPWLFLQSKFTLLDPEFSPDGRWITYVSTESDNKREVYIQAFPGPGEKRRISVNGGMNPVWARNGRELFYSVRVSPDKLRMMAVDIQPGAMLQASTPRVLFEGNWDVLTVTRGYDVTPDGKYFIMTRPEPPSDQPVTRLNVVLNWFDELKKRAPRSVP